MRFFDLFLRRAGVDRATARAAAACTSRLTVICPRDELGSLRKQICLDFSAAGLDVSQVQIDQGSDPGMASACITVNCPRIARRTDVPGPSPERQPAVRHVHFGVQPLAA